MSLLRATQVLLFAGVLAVLGARAIRRASTPPFEIALVHYKKTELELDGVTMKTNAIDTLVTVKAASARPGHIEVGPFALTPTTSIDMTGISVDMALPEGPFRVEGASGELRGSELTIRHAVVSRAGLEERRRVVKVDLETATATGE